MKDKRIHLKICLIFIVILVALVLLLSWFSRKNSICDEYSIHWKSDIATAVLVQNVSGGDVGKLYGSDIAKKAKAKQNIYISYFKHIIHISLGMFIDVTIERSEHMEKYELMSAIKDVNITI